MQHQDAVEGAILSDEMRQFKMSRAAKTDIEASKRYIGTSLLLMSSDFDLICYCVCSAHSTI